MFVEELSHEIGVSLGAAECESPRPIHFLVFIESVLGPLLRCQCVRQFVRVKLIASPGDVLIVNVVRNPKVVKGDETLYFDSSWNITSIDQISITKREEISSI